MQSQGRYAEAEPLLRESMEVMQAAFKDGHAFVAQMMMQYAGLLMQTGRDEEAAPLLETAVALFVERAGHEHRSTGEAHLHLGRCLAAIGRSHDAHAALQTARRILGETAAGQRQLEQFSEEVSTFYRAWGRASEAARWSKPTGVPDEG